MLILSRKKGEAFFIGRNIAIKLLDIRGDKARLGIDAGTDWPVHRCEVFHAIQREGGTVSDPLEAALQQIALQQKVIERLKAELEAE